MNITYTSEYDVGDVVIFKNGYQESKRLFLGIIEGFYVDNGHFWYNIKVNNKMVYTYSNRGDISEWDIVCKLDGDIKNMCFDRIISDK